MWTCAPEFSMKILRIREYFLYFTLLYSYSIFWECVRLSNVCSIIMGVGAAIHT